MSWNPTDDWRPSPPPIAADMEDVQTTWGILPRWKARALALGEIQAVVNALHGDVTIRNDAARVGASSLGEEDKPPRLAADEEPEPVIDPDVLDAIESKIDELATRMDRLERTKRAEQALLALEDEIEKMYPASPDDDDDDDMALKPRRH